jgi:hypothetical protein
LGGFEAKLLRSDGESVALQKSGADLSAAAICYEESPCPSASEKSWTPSSLSAWAAALAGIKPSVQADWQNLLAL